MRKLAFLFAFALCHGICQSPAPNVVEPAVLGVTFLLDATNGTLTPLADEHWKHATKRQGMFLVNYVIEISGEHSPVRVTSGKPIEFVFNVEHPESVKLRQSSPGKSDRILLLLRSHGAGTSQELIPSIPATLTKYGKASYKLVPESNLAPGEYALTYGDKAMTFGVDKDMPLALPGYGLPNFTDTLLWASMFLSTLPHFT